MEVGPATGDGATATHDRRWWTLAAVCVATFMLLLDITIVNVALPDIQRSLKSSFSDLQWVIDAYALSLAALLLTAGALADLFGRRLVFAVGLGLFTAASLLCGLATSPTFLNVARGLQGVGGAAMFATSLALLAQAFRGPERGTAFGIWGATIGAAVAIGPLVGGALTEGFGWESIFFINIPIGVAAIFVSLRQVAESRDPHATGIDWAGLLTFSLGLFLLVFGLVRGNSQGWGSAQIVGSLVTAALLLVAFVLVERRQERPMFDLSLFRRRAFTGAAIAAFCLSASMFSMFLYLTLYIQNSLGYTPLQAGLRFLPLSLVSFVVAPASGKLSARVPVRALIGGGLALVGIGLLLMRGLTPHSGWTALLPGFLVAGAGVGMVNPALASTAIGVVEPQRSGMASGISNTFRQVGIATGIAGLGALFQQLLKHKVPDAFAHAPERVQQLVHQLPVEAFARGTPPGPLARSPALRDAYLSAFTGALNDLFLVAAVVAFIGAVLGALLIRGSDFVMAQAQAASAAGRDAEAGALPAR
jgi:EmrB/QacA subfamily drug resistance transporter